MTLSRSLKGSKSGFLTVGDDYPRQDYEKFAFRAANERDGYSQRPAMFITPHGLLLLEWGRYGWNARWLDDPEPLDLGKISDD